jgi:hypothetical protein
VTSSTRSLLTLWTSRPRDEQPGRGDTLQPRRVVHQRAAVVTHGPHDGRPADPEVAGDRRDRMGVLAGTLQRGRRPRPAGVLRQPAARRAHGPRPRNRSRIWRAVRPERPGWIITNRVPCGSTFAPNPTPCRHNPWRQRTSRSRLPITSHCCGVTSNRTQASGGCSAPGGFGPLRRETWPGRQRGCRARERRPAGRAGSAAGKDAAGKHQGDRQPRRPAGSRPRAWHQVAPLVSGPQLPAGRAASRSGCW